MKTISILLLIGLSACALAGPIAVPVHHRQSTKNILNLEAELKQAAGEDKRVEEELVAADKLEESPGNIGALPDTGDQEGTDDQEDTEEKQILPVEGDAEEGTLLEKEQQSEEENEEEAGDKQEEEEYEYGEEEPDYEDMRERFLRALRQQALAYPQYGPDYYEEEMDAKDAIRAEIEAAVERSKNTRPGLEDSDLSDLDESDLDTDDEYYGQSALSDSGHYPKRFNLEDLQQYGGDVEAKVVAKKSSPLFSAPMYPASDDQGSGEDVEDNDDAVETQFQQFLSGDHLKSASKRNAEAGFNFM